MKITNNYNLPEAVFNFLSKDYYVPGDSDFSVTTLLSPPQVVQLERRHYKDLVEDATDQIWSLLGNGVHYLFEEHAQTGEAEQRLYIEIDGIKIGGQIDHYQEDTKTITDYKVTSAKTLKYPSRLKEWEEQQSMYAYIFNHNGKPVETIRVCILFRDWDKWQARRDPDYPQVPMKLLEFKYDEAKTLKLLKERIAVHTLARNCSDEDLPNCTGEDTWEKPTKYAIMKHGGKKASRVYDKGEDAEAYLTMIDKGGSHYVDVRRGMRTRCAEYCSASAFCHQYKVYKEGLDD